MVVYANGPIHLVEPWPPASPEERLGVDRRLGTCWIDRDRIPSDLLRYADEFDSKLSPEQRRAAREKRIAEDKAAERAAMQAAAEELKSTKSAPAGFMVVAHNEPGVSISAGIPLGDGSFLIREADLETVRSFGFLPVAA